MAIDACIVEVPKQHNTRDENAVIKEGLIPSAWLDEPINMRHKDVHARWTKKHRRCYCGYKNHVNVDVKHKLIRRHQATSAEVHDSQTLDAPLEGRNTNPTVWADSAYRSEEISAILKEQVIVNRIHYRTWHGAELPVWQRRQPAPLGDPRPGGTRVRTPGEVDADDRGARYRARTRHLQDRAGQSGVQHEPPGVFGAVRHARWQRRYQASEHRIQTVADP